MVRVYKNMMGDGSKIHVGEIAVSKSLNLKDAVITEVGSNSNGRWIKFGNGIQIAIGKITAKRSVDSNYTLPVTFKDETMIYGGVISTTYSYTSMGDAWRFAVGTATTKIRLYTPPEVKSFAGSGEIGVTYFVIGTWK